MLLSDKILTKTKIPIITSWHNIKTILCWYYKLKMSNKVKDINIEAGYTTFSIILSM